MRMKLNNPIVTSEMKVRMRTWRTPIGLLVYIGILVLFLLLFASIALTSFSYNYNAADYSEVGLVIFNTLSIVQFFIIVLVAPASTAGAISSEREKQTLDLLLCTQMSPTKIIIGKLISSLIWIFMMCISTVPLYSIAFLFGGVNPLAVIVVMLFYMLMSLAAGSIGLFYSTVFKKTVTSSIMSYLTIFLIFVLTIAIGYAEAFFMSQMGVYINMPIAFNFNPFLGFLAAYYLALMGSTGVQGFLFSGVPPVQVYTLIIVNIGFLVILSVLLLIISIRRISPIKGRRKKIKV